MTSSTPININIFPKSENKTNLQNINLKKIHFFLFILVDDFETTTNVPFSSETSMEDK